MKRGADQLVALHDQLYSRILTRYLAPEHTFTPHVLRLGYFLPPNALPWRSWTPGAMTERFTFGVDEIVAYRIGGRGVTCDSVRCRRAIRSGEGVSSR